MISTKGRRPIANGGDNDEAFLSEPYRTCLSELPSISSLIMQVINWYFCNANKELKLVVGGVVTGGAERAEANKNPLWRNIPTLH